MYCRTCNQFFCQRCAINFHQDHVTQKQQIEDCLIVAIKGNDKEFAMAGQKTSLELITSSQATPSVPLSLNQLSCWLTAPNNSQPVDCTITPSQPGNYNIHFTPTARGPHQLRVSVGGSDISGSPFTVHVHPMPEMRGHPLKIFHTELKQPYGLAVSKNGEIVVSENGGHCITMFSREGKKLGSFKGQLQRPRCIAITSDNKILVTDNHQIQAFTIAGECVTSVGQMGNEQLHFYTPEGIAVHPSGKVFVADSQNYRIQVLNSNLSYSHMFGSRGNRQGQFSTPWGVACDSNGDVYVTDQYNHRVQKFSADGQFILSFGCRGSEEGRLSFPTGICIDSTDTVYISEWGNHHVSVFNSSGKFLRRFGSEGSEKGQFQDPSGLAVDSYTGNLFVCDRDNHRVVIY